MRLVGPVPAKLRVSVDFLALPFGEPMLFRIASAYERATSHRMSPPGIWPVRFRFAEREQVMVVLKTKGRKRS